MKGETIQKDPDGKFVEEILPIVDRVNAEAREDKGDYLRSLRRVYAWVSGDKSEIYKGDEHGEDWNEDLDEGSPRHYPLMWAWSEAMAAIMIEEIRVTFIGGYNQGNDHVGELGNSLFEAYRLAMNWDVTWSDAFMDIILWQSCVIGPYVDTLSRTPDRIVGLRKFNPWQFACTRGRDIRYAPEKILTWHCDKSELIQMHPGMEPQIKDLKPWVPKVDSGEGRGRDNTRLSLYNDVPTAWGGRKDRRYNENTIEIQELWWRSTEKKRIGRQKDIEKARSENEEMNNYLISGQGSPPSTSLWLRDEEFHSEHIPIHEYWMDANTDKERQVRGTDTVLTEAIRQMQMHIQEHKDAAKTWNEENEGYVWVYPRGWRYALIANSELLLDEGDNPFLDEFGIVVPPLEQLIMCPDPLNPEGPSWAFRLADLNAIQSSGMNRVEDILESRDDKIIVDPTAIEGGIKAITNSSSEPIPVKPNKLISEVIQRLGAAEVPASVTSFLDRADAFMQQVAGIQDPALGKPGGNIRSGTQLAGYMQAGKRITNKHLRYNIPAVKNVAVWVWQISVGLGLNKDWLKPVIDGIAQDSQDMDLSDLEDSVFEIQVKIASDELTAIEEKRQVAEVVATKAMELYPYPGINDAVMGLMVDVYKDTFPGIKKFASTLAKIQQGAMQAAEGGDQLAGEGVVASTGMEQQNPGPSEGGP